MPKEEWGDIPGFKYRYQISNAGGVRKETKHGFVKIHGGQCSNGYEFVSLTIRTRKYKNILVHRLVAMAFVPNPNNLPCVNHKDGNKHNNHFSNLEWCTQSYNLAHAVKIGLIESQCKIRRKVIVENDREMMQFDTMQDCCGWFGFTKCWLGNYIKKHGNPCFYNGYKFTVAKRG